MKSHSQPNVFGLVPLLLVSALAQGQLLWTATGSLAQPRFQTDGILLNDGRVLLAGSLTCDPGCRSYPTAEIYDPSSGLWTETSPLNVLRFNHAAVKLSDGRVLVVGGYLTPSVLTATCEIFDPATGLWTLTGSLSTRRQFHKGVVLTNGKVLVVGGLGMGGNGSFQTLDSAELYDPASGHWSPAGSLSTARYLHSATLLADGRALITGGAASAANGTNQPTFASADLYDPETNSWKPAAPMSTVRSNHTANSAERRPGARDGWVGSHGRPELHRGVIRPSQRSMEYRR